MAWLAGLYKDGLFDQDNFSLDDTSIKAKVHNDEVGISMTSMGQMNNWNKERAADGKDPVWVGIPYPTADDGSISAVFGGSGIGSITGVITKTADEETMKLCLQALDYAYTAEGFLYWNYGIEGETWDYDDERRAQLPAPRNGRHRHRPNDQVQRRYLGLSCIQATNLLYQKNSQAAIEANDTWFYGMGRDTDGQGPVTPAGSGRAASPSPRKNPMNWTCTPPTWPPMWMRAVHHFLTGNKDINDDADWKAIWTDLTATTCPVCWRSVRPATIVIWPVKCPFPAERNDPLF